MEHHFDVDADAPLEIDVLIEDRVCAEQSQVERLGLHFLVRELKDSFLLFQLEEDLFFFEREQSLVQVGRLELVLETVLGLLGVEVALDRLPLFVLEHVLDVGGPSLVELRVPRETDQELVRLHLLVRLLLVHHRLDLDQLGGRLERILHKTLQLVFLLLHFFDFGDERPNDLGRRLFILLPRHLFHGVIVLVSSGCLLSDLVL